MDFNYITEDHRVATIKDNGKTGECKIISKISENQEKSGERMKESGEMPKKV